MSFASDRSWSMVPMFIFVWLCSFSLRGILRFIFNLINCFHVCVVSFSLVITSCGKGERELVALHFHYSVTFIREMYVINCFLFLLVPLEGSDLCLSRITRKRVFGDFRSSNIQTSQLSYRN